MLLRSVVSFSSELSPCSTFDGPETSLLTSGNTWWGEWMGVYKEQGHVIHQIPVLMTEESCKDCIKLPKVSGSFNLDRCLNQLNVSQHSFTKFKATWPRESVQNFETCTAEKLQIHLRKTNILLAFASETQLTDAFKLCPVVF